MKVRYLFAGIMAATLAFAGCSSPDELLRGDNDNVMELVVKGRLVQDESIEYDSSIDAATHTIEIQVPYYISDTDPIMSDLSEMKLRASMPLGAKFVPGLSGIQDLSENGGFSSTLVYESGERVNYNFTAVRVKSNKSTLLDVTAVTDLMRVTIGVSEPAEGEEKGKISIMNTSVLVGQAIQTCRLTVSPWATVEATGYDSATGMIDLSAASEVTIVAQDGSKSVYTVSIDDPSLVDIGKVGYVSNLFGFQFYQNDERGFAADAHYTIAVIGDDLIISNALDFSKMIVLNRYTGDLSTRKVNVSNIDSKFAIRAITSDDNGHLVAMTYTSTKERTTSTDANGHDCYLTDPTVMMWVWKNGIDSAPTAVVNANIGGGAFSGMASKPSEIGNTICVKGDMTSGNAVAVTVDKYAARQYAFYFTDGGVTSYAMECPAKTDGTLQWAPVWNASKALPLNVEKPLSYFLSSANQYQTVMLNDRTQNPITFTLPSSYWWKGSGSYDKAITGVDYVDFNGTRLLAISNGYVSNNVWSFRLYVSNIGLTPGAASLQSGFVFDTREDGSGHSITGTGYGATGMTSTYTFDSSKTMVGGNNTGSAAKRGDVAFAKSADGNSVQVYMMNMNAGIIAYEITRYDM